MPNRRRRKLSTAMSAVAALAVASPCAYFLVYESTETTERPEHHEFKQAAVLTDLPGELMSALSQGLSQFGINIPPVPSLTGSGDASTGLTGPGLTSPGLTSPGLTSPGLTDPALTSPGLTPTLPGSLAAPGTTLAPTPGVGANPALTNPALTSPTGATPGLTSPTGLDPALGGANEIPITTPVGLDPGADGTYPILGDPTLGTIPSSPGHHLHRRRRSRQRRDAGGQRVGRQSGYRPAKRCANAVDHAGRPEWRRGRAGSQPAGPAHPRGRGGATDGPNHRAGRLSPGSAENAPAAKASVIASARHNYSPKGR